MRAALLNLADQACAEPATRRPSARRLASTISAAIPSAADTSPRALPSTDAPAEEPGPLARLRAMARAGATRSAEHTSELQSLMRISYAVLCLKKTIHSTHLTDNTQQAHK